MSLCVSVILPAFNAERYIEKCIVSILTQTYSNIELIVINDGSTDRTNEIVKRFRNLDARIVVIDQKNQGQSAARNVGVEKAVGDYIFFIDADDYISTDCLEVLVSKTNEKPNTIFSVNTNKTLPDGSNIDAGPTHRPLALTNTEALKALYQQEISAVIWGKLFPSKLIKEIEFEENLKVGEDLVYLVNFFVKEDYKYVTLSAPFYYYLVSNGSTSRSFSEDKLLSELDKIRLLHELDRNREFDKQLNIMLYATTFSIFNNLLKKNIKLRSVLRFLYVFRKKVSDYEFKFLLSHGDQNISSNGSRLRIGRLICEGKSPQVVVGCLFLIHKINIAMNSLKK